VRAPRSARARRALWFAPTAVLWLWLMVLAVLTIVAGDALTGITLVLLAGCCLAYRLQARAEFRTGWRAGFVEGLTGPHERRVPAFALRAQVHGGDPTPEPWDALPPVDGVEVGIGKPPPLDDEPPSP
jgi:hypothetical protein